MNKKPHKSLPSWSLHSSVGRHAINKPTIKVFQVVISLQEKKETTGIEGEMRWPRAPTRKVVSRPFHVCWVDVSNSQRPVSRIVGGRKEMIMLPPSSQLFPEMIGDFDPRSAVLWQFLLLHCREVCR